MPAPAPARFPGRPFLTARWCNLVLATYAVPDDLLRPRLPPGVDLDRRDGRAFVSLVAFDFRDTKVLGVSWPGFRDFPELNLRFYVRHGPHRGVVFVREFVPKWAVATLARVLYNEPYRSAPMTSRLTETADRIEAEYTLDWAGRRHTIRAAGGKPGHEPGPDTVEHFFKEHEWGFNATRRGRPMRYRVRHPLWTVYPIADWSVDLDWAAVYGPEWGFLAKTEPYSTVFAAGSAVAVYPGTLLGR